MSTTLTFENPQAINLFSRHGMKCFTYLFAAEVSDDGITIYHKH